MVGPADGDKNENIFTHFDTINESNRRTDGHRTTV